MPSPKILIVEDQVIVARDLKARVAALGYDPVGTTTQGEEALVLTEQLRPDLVLMDIRLQGAMDGVEAALQIRERWHIPVVFLTAYAEGATLNRAKRAEPYGYIIKPFEDRELHTTLEMALYKHQSEQRLRQDAEIRQAILRTALDGYAIMDMQGHLLEVNDALCRMLGYSTEELLAKTAIELEVDPTPEPSQPGPTHWIKHDGGRSERRLRHKNGKPVDIEISANHLPTQGGRVFAFLRDISSRKRAERQLRQLSRAVEQSPVSLVITDAHGAIEYVNPKFCEVTGYRETEVLGKNPRVLKSGSMPAEGYRQLWQTITSGREWRGELHNRRKNGDFFWEFASISPIVDEAGRTTHYLAVKEDITERKRLEEQFRQAQKMEAVGQLAGGVAHDFNNILAATMLHLELLQANSDLSPELRASLKELMTQSHRAASLTRQLLMFSRRSVIQVRSLNLNEVIENLLKMLRRLIGEQINLEWKPQTDLPNVKGDAGMIEQVVMNLVVNARDAMPKGGRLVLGSSTAEFSEDRARLQVGSRPGWFVCLSVTDTGCGMDESTLKRIFEPFFTTKEPGKGTGLGLATVYGIVAQHQGWSTVESLPGQGTTFRIYLPVDTQATQSTGPQTPAPVPRGKNECIMLVEDEATVRETTANFLRRLGYRVLEAANGVEALKLWSAQPSPPDLLFSDMMMPEGMSGLDLVERLRADNPKLRVIISSGYSAELAHHGSELLHGIVYLPKPCPPPELATAIRRCLD